MINLFKDEEIILIQRRHWLPFLNTIIGLLFLGILPFIVFNFNVLLPENIQTAFLNYSKYYFFFSFSFIFILWLIFVIAWTNYYLDFVIITNKRIIDIEQFSLFHRDEAELRFEDVEDIKVEIIGFIQSVLKFGNINIQSAGENREIILKNIPNPYEIKNIIAKQIEKNRELKTN